MEQFMMNVAMMLFNIGLVGLAVSTGLTITGFLLTWLF